MSKIDRPRDMTGILASPCVFCGYNGQGYWVDKNHETKCPWYNIGDEERRDVLIKAASEGRLLILPEVDGSENGIAEAALKAIGVVINRKMLPADEEEKTFGGVVSIADLANAVRDLNKRTALAIGELEARVKVLENRERRWESVLDKYDWTKDPPAPKEGSDAPERRPDDSSAPIQGSDVGDFSGQVEALENQAPHKNDSSTPV